MRNWLRFIEADPHGGEAVDPVFMSHIMDISSDGLLTVRDLQRSNSLPPYDTVMETHAEMLDAKFTPEEVGNGEAAKAVIRELATTAINSLEQMNQPSES